MVHPLFSAAVFSTARPRFIAFARATGKALLNLLIPPRCLSCGAIVSETGTLCVACWKKLHFITKPCCTCCGLPFDYDLGQAALCPSCLYRRPRFARARAALRYDDGSRALILRFKHADHTSGAKTFARWMAHAGVDLLAETDIIIPVPLHRLRLFKRRYNQAALLGHHLSRLSGKVCRTDLLIRWRNTKSQSTMGRRNRSQNLRGAFRVRKAADIAGKRCLVIDDVFTSGATLSECTKALIAAGAKSVDVLTLARVIRTE